MMALQNSISFLLILLCLKTLLAGKPYRGNHVRTTSFDTVVEGKALKNHVIDIIHEYSQIDCGFACLRATNCQSYNARQEKVDVFECELSSSTKGQQPNDFVDAPGVTYFGSDTFPALGCDAGKCRYENKCKESKIYPYYHCQDDEFDLKFPSTNHTWKGNNTDNLIEISVCFWFKSSHAASGTFFGYKNDGTSPSVMSLGYSNNDLSFGINAEQATFTMPPLYDDEWHHLCVTWNSTSGHVNVFVDGVIRGYPSGKSFFKDAIVKADGVWTLGHFGGSADYTGKMSQFNAWYTVLPSDEIKAMAMTCTLSHTSTGSIVKWGRDFTPSPSESAESRDCSKRDISSEDLGDSDLHFSGQSGTSSFKAISNIPSLDSFTISWWLKTTWIPTAGTQLKAIASFTKDLTTTLLVALRGSFELHFLLGSEECLHKLPPISDDRWHHMAITWENENGQWDFYLDGVHRALFNNFQKRHVVEGSYLIIGKSGDDKGSGYTSDEDLVGSLSRFNIWKYRLSVDRIVMHAKHPGFESGDVASWKDIQQNMHGHVVRTKPSTVVSSFGLSNVRLTMDDASEYNHAILPYDGEGIKQLTVCAWLFLVYTSTAAPGLISYASPSNSNEFYLEFYNGKIKSSVGNTDDVT
ncbi:uncharacterized protein LOC114522721 [Dendronephthya gigantea]|uniref:uncharacterized protein LOC114522721 n=1 Tax=Dendronephthya gigantea TaxID=151771 RepID=UPI00106D6E9A|nr:uncharacterized protein LOC114522721 [Dendronephthya gigantea]